MTSNCAVKQSIGSSVIAFAKIFEMTVKQVHKHVRVGRRTQFCSSRQLADLKSVGISGTPLDLVDFNSFNRIFTIVYIAKNINYNFTQNTSSSIFFIFWPLRALSEPTLVKH